MPHHSKLKLTILLATTLGTCATLAPAAPPTTPSTSPSTPYDFVRDWWLHGQPLPTPNSPPVRHLLDAYAATPDDPELTYWVALAQSNGLLHTNHPTLDLIRSAADQGLPDAQARLGLALVEGTPPPADPQRGLQLLQQADAQSSPDAALDLGRIYLAGLGGTPKDPALAESYLKSALSRGHIRAHYYLFELYNHRPGDTADTLRELQAGAEAGDERAMESLGRLYQSGAPTLPPGPVQALKWFQKSAERGYPPAQCQIVKAILSGFGGVNANPQNFAVANMLLSKAVASNYPEALRLQARVKLTGELDTPLDPAGAVSLLERGVAANDAQSMSDLATLYIEGFALPRDINRARELTERAASLGLPEAKLRLPRFRLTPPTTAPSARATSSPNSQLTVSTKSIVH